MVQTSVDDVARYSEEAYDFGEIYGKWKDDDGDEEIIAPPFGDKVLDQIQLLAETGITSSSEGVRKSALQGLEMKFKRILNPDVHFKGLERVGSSIVASLGYSGGGEHRLILSKSPCKV